MHESKIQFRILLYCPAVWYYEIVAVAQVAGSRPQPPFRSTKWLGNIVGISREDFISRAVDGPCDRVIGKEEIRRSRKAGKICSETTSLTHTAEKTSSLNARLIRHTNNRVSDGVPSIIVTHVIKSRSKLKYSLPSVCAGAAGCPFDFSHLIHVVIEAKESFTLLQVLTSARLTITHLASFGTITSQVNLSEFPALTCLELRYSRWQLLYSLGPGNCLESLVFYLESYEFQTHPELLSEKDAFVANTLMPSLQEVEVLFGGEKSELEAITSYCLQLLARGLLAVTTHPDRTRSLRAHPVSAQGLLRVNADVHLW
ncbi:hypothetical protein DFH09DRAFT_1089010 [Mycena vulgaris]|nr:hypothetical protein DFH09DRAFT_1089010 [Mycena vulgaris]